MFFFHCGEVDKVVVGLRSLFSKLLLFFSRQREIPITCRFILSSLYRPLFLLIPVAAVFSLLRERKRRKRRGRVEWAAVKPDMTGSYSSGCKNLNIGHEMKNSFLPSVLHCHGHQNATLALVVCDGFKQDTSSEPTSQHDPRSLEQQDASRN